MSVLVIRVPDTKGSRWRHVRRATRGLIDKTYSSQSAWRGFPEIATIDGSRLQPSTLVNAGQLSGPARGLSCWIAIVARQIGLRTARYTRARMR